MNFEEKERDDGIGIWFIYDSLNNPEHYLQNIKPVLKRINYEKNYFEIYNCQVQNQIQYNDCGLFALAFAIAICENIEPAQLKFDQNSMRRHFNWTLNNQNSLIQFSNEINYDFKPKYTKHIVDISNVFFKF